MALKYRKKNETGTYIFVSVFGLVLFLLSASVVPFLAGQKGVPSPDLLLGLVCASSAFLDRRKACIFAVIFGFMSDLFITSPTAFSPIVYLAAVLIVPRCLMFFSRHGTVITAVCSVPAIAVRCIVRAVATSAVFGGVPFASLLSDNVLYTFMFTFASCIVICFVCRRLIYRIKTGA